jgi:inorganic pyrophosphatase
MRKRSTRPAMPGCPVDADPIANLALINDPERDFKRVMKDGVTCKNTL